MRAVTTITATAAALVLATTGSSLAGQAGPSAGPPAGSAAGAAANRAGDGHAPTTTVDGRTVAEPNPYLGLVADPTTVNGAYWKRQLARESAARDTHRVDPPNPFVYEEQEPADTLGANDDQASAELLQRLGTDKRAAVRILGQLSQPDIDTEDLASDEDDGSIPLANETGIPEDTEGVLVESRIGNGPHGPNGDDSGDFDVFAVDAAAGDTITIDTRGSAVDTVVAVYDAEGTLVGVNDDVEPGDFDSLLRLPVDEDGTYYALVAGFNFFGPLPNDPFDSGSGNGSGDVGTYTMTLGVGDADLDYYAVRLKAGDVLGGTIGGSSSDLSVWRYDGRRVLGTTQDASSLYPVESPLPGGDTTAAYVAEESGRYAVSTQAGDGPYTISLEVYRPGSQSDKVRQTVFLDFDGERLNTGPFGGAGVRTLSPLTSFFGGWGLPQSAKNAVIDRIVATVRENLRHDLVEYGLNDDVSIRILNSRDDVDPFGKPNVSRVVVGGTVAQSGVDTIGISQSIDPGNFGHEETALVLLDTLSGTPEDEEDATLNSYIEPESDVVDFVGTAVGNVTSHEIGHFVGSYHVDQFNRRLNLMDQGGNFPLLYGVGDDGIGGTADDPDVDFGQDAYNPAEGFLGLEDTLNNSAWAFLTRGPS